MCSLSEPTKLAGGGPVGCVDSQALCDSSWDPAWPRFKCELIKGEKAIPAYSFNTNN